MECSSYDLLPGSPVPNTHLAHSLRWGPRLWQTWQAGALHPHRQLMHNSNFSSSNGSTEDLFRDSIDSCDNDITEKVGPGTLCMSLGCMGVVLQAAALWGLGLCAHRGDEGGEGHWSYTSSSPNMSALLFVVIWRSLS